MQNTADETRTVRAAPFDTLSDPVRRRLLELLAGGEQTAGKMTLTIQADFGIGQSAVSQHLKVLRDGGFVSVRVDGARRIYTLAAAPFTEVEAWLSRFRTFWTPKPDPMGSEPPRGARRRSAAAERGPADEAQLEMF